MKYLKDFFKVDFKFFCLKVISLYYIKPKWLKIHSTDQNGHKSFPKIILKNINFKPQEAKLWAITFLQ